jgi:hypothetical protein
VPAKPLSELDFLDLLGQPVASPNSLPAPVVEAVRPVNSVEASEVVSTTGKTGVTGNSLPLDTSDNSGNTNSQTLGRRALDTSNSGNTDNAVKPGKRGKRDKSDKLVQPAASVEPLVAADSGDVRQTLILSKNHLEQLRDLVHARRTAGDYAYSQKQAVREALDLLFAANGIAAPRSDQARDRERQHRERISKGRQLRTAKGLPPDSDRVD